MAQRRGGRGVLLPRWAYRLLWNLHRAGYAVSGGRLGLRTGADDRLGTLRLLTIGRRSGQERATMLYYLPVGTGYAVVASNAGSGSPPAWWLNLQAQPRATVVVPAGTVAVSAREAGLEERERLWSRFATQLADYDRYAAKAGRHIPIVLLEPVAGDGEGRADADAREDTDARADA